MKMTTTVKVMAHCASDKQVRITRREARVSFESEPVAGEHTVIQNGETYEQVVYDDWMIYVKEEPKPA
jgi:hypothetical protein